MKYILFVLFMYFLFSCTNCHKEEQYAAQAQQEIQKKHAELSEFASQMGSESGDFNDQDVVIERTTSDDELGYLIIEVALLEADLEDYKKEHCDCF